MDLKEGGSRSQKLDEPPNSRLFIVCNKSIGEEDFRSAFGKFGTIEEIWVVRDRVTQEPKGVTYIKFSKTSEAALALEEMNGECIGSFPRPLKVMVASSREQGSRREVNEEERLLRLFCVVPRSMTDSELREHFVTFGDIDYVSVLRDRETKESKGFAYVKYHRVSHAAKAFEECDRTFRAVFAEPKRQKPVNDVDHYSTPSLPPPTHSWDSQGPTGGDIGGGTVLPATDPALTLRIVASPTLNQDQLWRLFDLVPGLDFLHLDNGGGRAGRGSRGTAVAVYSSVAAAQWARDKLHGFEFPPGQRLIVRHEQPPAAPAIHSRALPSPREYEPMGGGRGSSTGQWGGYDGPICSVKLPPVQPLAHADADCKERLFVVCQRGAPPTSVLRDVFSRFGSLLDVYMLSGKSCGYVKFASAEAAREAIQTLHGQEVAGSRLKVMAADPRGEDRRKRLRVDDS